MPELLGYQFDRVYAAAIERYRTVSTIAERDAIPTGKRYQGMLCYVTGSTQVDYQLRGGTSNAYWEAAANGNYFDLSVNTSDDITEGVVNLFMDGAQDAKLAFITVTQDVDLDQMEIDIAALGSGITFKGTWSPSGGVFPGGGTTAIGDLYIADDGGTIDSVTFASGDGIIATVVNASTATFAGNWAKTESVSDVTSVVGLTGVISKSALLAALNVEDGATADMTGAELVAAITSYLTTADWQTQLTQEEVLDFVGQAINDGTQTKITVTYDDDNDLIDFTVDPFIQVKADLATLVADQGTESDDILYEVTDASGSWGLTSGRAWVRWKGTTTGDATDYILVSSEETGFASPLTTKGDLLAYDTDNVRLPVGADGQVLTADSAEATGIKWAAVSGVGDMLKSVYDAANIVEQLVGLTATQTLTNKTLTAPLGIVTNDVTESTDKNYVTDAELVVIGNTSGTNTGDNAVNSSALALDQTTPQSIINGQPIQDSLTASEIVATDGSKKLQSLAVATYPSLTELSYVKGVTSAIQTQLGAMVTKALFDANTILAATTDNTPVALTVAEQTLVGRITGGAIASLTVTQLKTLLTDRLEEDATVTGTKNIDWTDYETFRYTLTGACTFSDTNLPASGGKVITIHMSGDFAPTYPSGWTTYIDGTYDGTVRNLIVVEYVKAGTPFFKVSISQPD